MMHFKHQLATVLLFCIPILLQAQAPFWSETFNGKIPAGWTNEDKSGQNVKWKWCSNPTAGGALCPAIWADLVNDQRTFQSTTAANGFMLVDSDEAGDLPKDHIATLTSTAINCTGKSKVFIRFQSHLGIYNEGPDNRAVLRVSKDNVNWKKYVAYPKYEGGIGNWTNNPEAVILDISDMAANAATVYLQWEWTGNFEYHWLLDDVELYSADPRRHDLAIGPFYYPVSSFVTPATQIATDTFGSFEALISNPGSVAQKNVKLRVQVTTEAGAVLFDKTRTVPALAAGVTDSLIGVEGSYVPKLDAGVYRIVYSVSSDSADIRPGDNRVSSRFVVSGTGVFSKEAGATTFRRPGSNTPPDEWAVCNLYRMSSGNFDKFQATVATFSFLTNPDEIAPKDVEAEVFLMKLQPDIDEDLSNLDDSDLLNSFDLVGMANYNAPDTMANDGSLQGIRLVDQETAKEGVLLERGARYLLALNYTGNSSRVYQGFGTGVVYYFPSTLLYSGGWSSVTGLNATLRLTIALLTTTDEKKLPDNTMNVFPNPAGDVVYLGLDFASATDATITLADITGRVLRLEDRNNLQNDRLEYALEGFAPGTYLARIATKEGTLTKKFVVK